MRSNEESFLKKKWRPNGGHFFFRNNFRVSFLHLYRKLKSNMENQQEEQSQLNIELTEEIAEGTYANLAIITHSNAEFVVDFVNVMPGMPKAKVKSRVILTPQHAKRFMKAMLDNIKKYESIHGPIQDQEPVSLPMNFGGPTAQA
jgi:hypothetical protein